MMKSIPRIALEFMNRDHAEFAELCEGLLHRIDGNGSHDEIDGMLAELLDHTGRHFAAEEKIMQESGFPPIEVHRGEHERVLGDLSSRIEDWHRNRDSAALRAWVEFVYGNWFVGHVSTMDMMTAGYIAANQKTD